MYIDHPRLWLELVVIAPTPSIRKIADIFKDHLKDRQMISLVSYTNKYIYKILLLQLHKGFQDTGTAPDYVLMLRAHQLLKSCRAVLNNTTYLPGSYISNTMSFGGVHPKVDCHCVLSAPSSDKCEPVGTDIVPLVAPSTVSKDTVVISAWHVIRWCRVRFVSFVLRIQTDTFKKKRFF